MLTLRLITQKNTSLTTVQLFLNLFKPSLWRPEREEKSSKIPLKVQSNMIFKDIRTLFTPSTDLSLPRFAAFKS